MIQTSLINCFSGYIDENKTDAKAAAVWGFNKGAIEILGTAAVRSFFKAPFISLPMYTIIHFGAGYLATELSQKKVYNPITNSMIDNPLSHVLNDSWFSKPVTKDNFISLTVADCLIDCIGISVSQI